MSSSLAPAWALFAEAVDGLNDSHLPQGIHVRALPSATLGVPATPLVVYRTGISRIQLKRLAHIGGVVWVDSGGAILTEPFTVTPDNPVIGYFPATDVIWTELQATPAIEWDLPPRRVRRKIAPPVGSGMTELAASLQSSPHTLAVADASLNPAIREVTKRRRIASLSFQALANSSLGPALFQSRSQAPYVLAASSIPMVRVVGHGTVRSIRWLDMTRVRELGKESLWEIWSLPVKAAPRYHPTPNAIAEAKDRLTRAAVQRQPLYVAYGSASPVTAPPATGSDAMLRVDQVRGELDRWLHKLLHDTSRPTWELTDDQAIQGTPNSTVSVPIEPFLIGGAVDPDVGHFLGFGSVDEKFEATEGSLLIYRVRGLWRWSPKKWGPPQRDAFTAAVRAQLEDAVNSFPELKEFNLVPNEAGPFIDVHALTAAVVGYPSDPPAAVQFDDLQDRGWFATPAPPDVRRGLRLLAHGFLPHSLAALAATDANGLRTLNPFPKAGRIKFGQPLPGGLPLSLVVSRPADASSPTEGRFEDRDVPDSPVRYQLAQGDWFGRWSPWVYRDAPAKPRTPPMRPTIELYPQPPIVPSPVPSGLLAGTIQVRIPIPRTPDLPPGGASLQRLDLVETFDGAPAVTLGYTLGVLVGASIEAHPAPEHDLLVINRTGPALARCASRKVSYTARWVDVLNQVSLDADPAARTITDPRPPELPGVITELRYTSRPDVQGHARVDLDINTTSGMRYRVFASTEPTLLKALEDMGQHAAANDIRSAVPGAPRAMKFKLYKSLFTWSHFENLTPNPIVATSSVTHFVHRVSGSLDVLAIYRVLGEGASGALSEMSEAELVPFAVPNLGGPMRPQVSLVNAGLDATTQGVVLRVKVPRGKAVPKAWRLRRASVPVNDPLRMDIVDQGSVTGATVDGEATSFEIVCSQPLTAWKQYRFAVEVQADQPPGAPTVGVVYPGEWSQASAPTALAVIPPAGPAAASGVTVANGAGVLNITVTHAAAASLVGTAVGPHRFELWRVEPGQRPSRREALFRRGVGDTWVASDAGIAPVGAYVTVRIIDPIGRRSEAAISNQI
jgi:hypothetical protein